MKQGKDRKPCAVCGRLPAPYRISHQFGGGTKVRRSVSSARGMPYCREHANEEGEREALRLIEFRHRLRRLMVEEAGVLKRLEQAEHDEKGLT